ncbi:kinesin KP1 isoform X1 [Cinnamomum micranthum f. kanehirae]|uniref:Kinesin KP1 isoform X1 n=1 Tax=Cinnamomum micranthum f. kanehirae TaxID=337451 RepID=A0A3S3PZF6_9MAGN|nr:kinesin KP1 isoform X1 [Cinnamomum micranthum f. kanehirae]
MEETFQRNHSRKSIQSLSETIRSLLGFKTHLTPGWADSVCKIIKELPSEKPSAGPNMVDSSEGKDTEVDADISKIQDDLTVLNAHLNQLNLQRRKALNDFLDLKGNIRVFCRIRPVLADEKCGSSRPVVALDSSNLLLKFAENKRKHYSFDKVFHPGSSQDEVFSEVEPVIKSALDGYNVCIFAYGQTGTGKTFTMEGKPDGPGVIPRAMEALFKQALDTNHKFLFTFSMLEIYMGSLRDLLVPQNAKRTDPTTQCLPIKMDPSGGVEIDNLVAITVSDFNQAKRLYKLGSRLRSTASTNSNVTSSRSHCLIRISVTCSDAPERRRETNKVWMVDLGGSERLLKTKARGRRLEEGKAINLSLSALGDVINALQRKKTHVPYRNSKLTQILRDSLGEDSKTIMLVHVSPKEDDLCETVCSLGFASRVRSVHLVCEESTEVKAEKEVAMNDLLHKVKNIEYDRQNARRDIEKLNEKLKHITKTDTLPDENLEDPHLSHYKTQSRVERKKQNVGNFIEALSSRLPRFMRPTICSQQKTGVEHQSSEITRKKELIPRRRRNASSVRAESVTFPINRSQSECGSDALGFTWKHSKGYGSECSHEALECDIKMVIFPEPEKSSGNSVCSISVCSHDSINESESRWTDKIEPEKHLSVDNWLRLQKDEPTSTGIHGNKRVLAIPLPQKKHKQDRHKHETIVSKAKILHRVRDADTVNKKSQGSEFAEKELCDHYLTEQISACGMSGSSLISSSTNAVDVNDNGCDQISTSDVVSELASLNNDLHLMVLNTETDKEREELYETELRNEISGESDQAGQKEAIASKRTVMRENSGDGYFCGSPQQIENVVKPSLHLMRSRRALFMAKKFSATETAWNTSDMPFNESPEIQQNTG